MALGEQMREAGVAWDLHTYNTMLTIGLDYGASWLELMQLVQVRVSVNPHLFFCRWALFPLCFFSDSYEKKLVKFIVFF